MKKTLILFSALIIAFSNANAQSSESCKISQMITAGHRNFQIIGKHSNVFVDSLFAHFPKSKRKGYIWKFKNIEIPGIDEPLTLQVNQGLFGREVNNDSTKCKNGSYFTTFTSEKYKKYRLENRKVTEEDAIIIYVKNGREFGVKNEEDAELIKAYLLSIYGS